MAWWTKVGSVIEKHDGPKPKLDAAIRLNFAVNMAGHGAEECHLYRRDPAKHPDEPDLFPAEMAKAKARLAKEKR